MSGTRNIMSWTGTGNVRLADQPGHRNWLLGQAHSLLDFFQFSSFNPKGGFFPLDSFGQPMPPQSAQNGIERQLHETTRAVHCFSIAHLLGVPGADRNIDHAMAFLWERHRDKTNGGYFWGVDDEAPTNATKQAYGHAFVLLAASSAKIVGHPDADRLLEDISDVLQNRFWDSVAGATTEEYSADWQSLGDYRGQNSNMHLTEALMAAFEATNDSDYLLKAESIAALIINHHAREQGWRVAEHFDNQWQIDRTYAGDPMFRPRGTTPGHALEWSRLLVLLWELGGRKNDWMPKAAKSLFFMAVETGWDRKKGGFYYTLDWDNQADRPDRFWWPCAEGIAAAAVLGSIDEDPRFEEWYRRIWGFTNNYLIDHKHGGWFPELSADLEPLSNVFVGKPDLYHALQACLIPLLSAKGSITRGLIRDGTRTI